MMADYLSRLADFIATTPSHGIPPDVRSRASLIVADCIGCMVAGARTPVVQRLAARFPTPGDAPSFQAPGLRQPLAVNVSAYLGGISGTWHDLDEGNLHSRTHAAIQILPAALAESASRELSGRALIDAIVLAYEVASRLWGATTARLAVHPHGTYGPLAAAAALCRLRGDGASATREALNMAMTLGLAASRQTLSDGATVRNVYTGHSGKAGFEALLLRDTGFSAEEDAPTTILGSIYGEKFDADASVRGLGDVWWMRKNYFKRFASGRYMHGVLDALESLMLRPGVSLQADAIERIDVSTFFMAATLHRQTLRTPFALRFSIPAAIARIILHGWPGLTDDGSDGFADPEVHKLAERVFVQEDPDASAAYPDRQPTRLRVTFTDGRVEEAACERILGEYDHPLPPGALQAKFRELVTGTIDDAAVNETWSTLTALDDAASVAEVCVGLNSSLMASSD
jgi:2-methylcitrate dehydratase PrpD